MNTRHRAAVAALWALLLPQGAAAAPLPASGAADGGPSVLLSNADGLNPYSSVVQYQGRTRCTGVFIATTSPLVGRGDAPAYIVSNGHCSGFPGSNEVNVNRLGGGRVTFNYFADTTARQLVVPVARVAYESMKGQDISVLELGIRESDLIRRGFRPWRVSAQPPPLGEAVVVVGVPLQRDPAASFLRIAACRFQGTAPRVAEYIWAWFDLLRNDCADVAPGSSGSPMISRTTGRVLGLVNTTTRGAVAFTDCFLDHPCEPVSDGAAGRLNTSYATPLAGLDRCFDLGGQFALGAQGCSLDPGVQVRVQPSVIGAQNPLLSSLPFGQVRRRWNVTVSGPFAYYRYKVAALPEQSCREPRGYGAPRRIIDDALVDEPLPTRDGFYDLCVIGGPDARWTQGWQSTDFPSVVSVRIDTIGPRIPSPLQIEDNGISWRVTFVALDPEISIYLYKFGRPSDTRCEDPDGYRPNLIPFITLPKSGRPYLLCAIPYDAAGNPGRILEVLLP